jgi:branched-chain amino acid transport system ATP-binding protein
VSAAPLLDVIGLEVVYGRAITALHNVTLHVDQGRLVALLGANGAGKTTTLRAISGFFGQDHARVTKGTIRYHGEAIENLSPPQLTRRGIVLVPERDKVFPNLTVAENLAVVHSRRISAAERRDLDSLVFDFFPRLAELRKLEAGLLSGGERQMLALGAAIVCAPQLLLVDELSLGLAPVIVADLAKRLVEIQRELKITFLLVEQSAHTALAIADYCYVLENGVVAYEGSAEALRNNDVIKNAYLGTGRDEQHNYRALATRRLKASSDG